MIKTAFLDGYLQKQSSFEDSVKQAAPPVTGFTSKNIAQADTASKQQPEMPELALRPTEGTPPSRQRSVLNLRRFILGQTGNPGWKPNPAPKTPIINVASTPDIKPPPVQESVVNKRPQLANAAQRPISGISPYTKGLTAR